MWREIKDSSLIDWHNIHKKHHRKIASSRTVEGVLLGIVCLDCSEIYIYDVILPEEKLYQ